VEIDEIACADVDGADTQALFAGVDAVEVDQALERRLKRGGVIIAGGVQRSHRLQPWDWKARYKETRRSPHHGETSADLVRQTTREVTSRRGECKIGWPARHGVRRHAPPGL